MEINQNLSYNSYRASNLLQKDKPTWPARTSYCERFFHHQTIFQRVKKSIILSCLHLIICFEIFPLWREKSFPSNVSHFFSIQEGGNVWVEEPKFEMANSRREILTFQRVKKPIISCWVNLRKTDHKQECSVHL